jgi:putative transposase
MTRLEDRQILLRDIGQARTEGARLAPACALAGIDARTLQRWKAGEGLTRGDRRPDADHPVPPHALSEAERAQIVAVCNEPRFAETPPAQIVPALADEGIYIASESSFHRVLRAHGQMNRRGRAQPPRTPRPPTTHIATRPGDVWCWDVTLILSANSENCQCGQCMYAAVEWHRHGDFIRLGVILLPRVRPSSMRPSLPPNADGLLRL